MKPFACILSFGAAAILSIWAETVPATVPDRLIRSGVEAPGPATRRGPIVLTEIHAAPATRSDGRDVRFIELYNSNPYSQRMGGWKLSGSLAYTFPAGYKMPGLSRLVIAPVPADVEAAYGITGVLQADANESFTFPVELTLSDEIGAELFSIKVKDADPWPAGIAGTGHSLALARPSRGQTEPAAWSRSVRPGGSPNANEPSANTAYATILINELVPHSPSTGTSSIELINIGDTAVSLAGCRLVSQTLNASYTFPSGTTLAAHQFLAVNEATLGFAVSGNKDSILLRAPVASGDTVIDATRLPSVALDGAYGRAPDGGARFTHLASPTPGTRNAARLVPPVVLNELMYHPLDEDKEHEYLELHNPTANDVNLTGWVISGDIDYDCTETIPAGGYLVIANKRSAFRALYPAFDGLLGVDGFSGSLPNGTGTVRLRRPMSVWDAAVSNVVNALVLQEEVVYHDGGAWGDLADGGGSSLERVDWRADPHDAGSWSASDETHTCTWKTLEFTGAIEYGRADDNYGDPTQVELGLYGAGECLIDSVVLKSATGSNLVNNPSFESANTTWKFHGTHQDSTIENSTDADNGARVLHLRTTGRLHTGGNGIRGTLSSQLPKSGIGTISMRVRWLAGSPDALMRARGNWIEACGDITTTHAFGTPGRINSRATTNAAPAIVEVTHEPLLPANGQPVTVYARVADPDGLASVNLIWHLDGISSSTTIPMNPCEAGWFAATIPAPANNSLVAFHVTATDGVSTTLSSNFPADTRRECLVRWNDPHTANTFGVYRFWVTAADLAIWQNRSQDSNYSIPCTFVYGNDRVVYGAGIQYGGSPFHCKGFSRPINNGFIDYKLDFPKDDQVLEDDGLVLACAGNPGGGEDPTMFKEQFCYALAKRLGQPAVYRRVVHLYANGQLQNAQGAVEDTEKPNGSMIDHWYPTKRDGRLYKCDDWFEYNPNNFGDFRYNRGGKEIGATLESFTTTEGNGDPAFGVFYKKSRYRWHWLPRAAANFQAHDYQDFYTLIHAVNDFANPAYVRNLAAVADLDAFLTISALHVYVGNYDSYGNERGKNAYLYNGPRGWALLAWDIDTSFGAPNTRDTAMTNIVDPQSSGLKVIDPSLKAMLANYEISRAYWRKFIALTEACSHGSEDIVDYRARYEALRADGVSMSGFNTVTNNIRIRRANVLGQITAANAASFTLSSPTVSDQNQFTLTGEAPFEVATITCNGKPLDVTWTSPTRWTAPFVLTRPTTTLTLTALREDGTVFGTATGSITYTGAPLDSLDNHLVIAAIMSRPPMPGGAYFEIYNTSTNTSFDLGGVYTVGSANFTFSDGFILAPRTSAVVIENPAVFSALYGNRATVAGTFTGSIPSVGSLELRRPAKGLELVESTLDYVEWGGEGWPIPDEGEALTLISPALDNAQPACWRTAVTREIPLGTRILLPLDQIWRYSTTKPADNWKTASFNDAAWPAGAGPLGHDPDASNWSIHFGTDVPLDNQRATYYFRAQFNYTPPNESAGVYDTIKVRYLVDDCAALYLNGVELHRSARTPSGALNDTSLATTHTPQELEGTFTEFFELDPSLLHTGANTLAVEVHQNVMTSSDIAWAIEIDATSVLSDALPPGRYQPATTIPDGLPAFVPNIPTPPVHGFNDIRLNEFMAQNTLFANPLTNAFDDWFELYNNGTNTVSLGGWVVTDTLKTSEPPTPNPKATKSLVLPASVMLAPGEALRIWTGADDAATLPFDPANLKAPFGLSKSADAIYLFDPATNLVDAINYAAAPSDTTSLGRWPNGTGEWTTFAVPTPGTANHPARFDTPLLAGANAYTLRVGTPFTSVLAPENVFAANTTFALVPETGSSIPNGLSVNSSTGTLNWTPSSTLAPGVYFLNLCPVADGEAIDALPITFTVLPPVSDVLIAVGLEAETLATTQTLRLTWQGQPNATYTVEWCDDLTTANWQPFPEAANLQGPIGPQSILLDLTKLGPRKPQAFFRVKETK